MLNELSWSYNNYFKQNILIINAKVLFYQQVSFEILDEDTFLKVEVKVHVGDIIDVVGMFDDNDENVDQWFAKISAIFIHENNNNNNCLFLILEWFEIENFDTNFKCHRYKLQSSTEDWKTIHSITIITAQPKWHFVHDCRSGCVEKNHDIINNRIFYRNDYLYTAV
jgi:hypothetical protein